MAKLGAQLGYAHELEGAFLVSGAVPYGAGAGAWVWVRRGVDCDSVVARHRQQATLDLIRCTLFFGDQHFIRKNT